MDVRTVAPVVALSPVVLGGTLFIFGTGLDFVWNLQAVAGCTAYLLGVAGVVGLVLASVDRIGDTPERVQVTILLLAAGIISAVTCIALYATAPRNNLVSIFVVSNLSYPIIVGVETIRRLRTLLTNHTSGEALSLVRPEPLCFDIRVMAAIIPMAPFLFVGAVTVYSAAVRNGIPTASTFVNMSMLASLSGLLGLIGLFFASIGQSYRQPLLAKVTITLLVCGVMAAVGTIVLSMSDANDKVALIFAIAHLLCPLLVGVDAIGRLKASISSGFSECTGTTG